MATSTEPVNELQASEALPEEIEWRVHPLFENFWRSALLIVIMAATLVGVWAWTGYGGLVLLALIFLVVSMAPYFFPTRYYLTSEGIEINFLGVKTFRAWSRYKNFYTHDVGVHLSTFTKPNGLDAFRGNFIRFAPNNRDEVLRFLNAHIRREKQGFEQAKSER